MSAVIIESVPNFSEGRRPEVIQAIAIAMASVQNIRLIHTDVGYDANRTVYTLIGTPEDVCEALFRACETAIQHIDMRKHEGNHPRMGVMDVCPLIPIAGISIEDLRDYAFQLGQRLGRELGLPVFYYEYSALHPHKKNLADIRNGEYEGMAEKMEQPAWASDNDCAFNVKTGTTALGVRDFLLAYNVNLESRDVNIAKKIARSIREKGNLISEDGNEYLRTGALPGVKAIGWLMEEYDCAQVSTNITNLKRSNPGEVFLAVRKEAAKFGIEVLSSELIGMIPLFALKNTADGLGLKPKTEDELIELVQRFLGLDIKEKFDLRNRVIDLFLK